MKVKEVRWRKAKRWYQNGVNVSVCYIKGGKWGGKNKTAWRRRNEFNDKVKALRVLNGNEVEFMGGVGPVGEVGLGFRGAFDGAKSNGAGVISGAQEQQGMTSVWKQCEAEREGADLMIGEQQGTLNVPCVVMARCEALIGYGGVTPLSCVGVGDVLSRKAKVIVVRLVGVAGR
ncbi:hypothetical protein VNO78_31723 [Psophocarpus tetragonolobus]|uniref:Uncharacterized protein n=1 Tax=Psophocarpus tetragonolobus TaxID=3891 RepID=A0AAN9S0Q6_PSOTE